MRGSETGLGAARSLLWPQAKCRQTESATSSAAYSYYCLFCFIAAVCAVWSVESTM
jgi:hypothetical protein